MPPKARKSFHYVLGHCLNDSTNEAVCKLNSSTEEVRIYTYYYCQASHIVRLKPRSVSPGVHGLEGRRPPLRLLFAGMEEPWPLHRGFPDVRETKPLTITGCSAVW